MPHWLALELVLVWSPVLALLARAAPSLPVLLLREHSQRQGASSAPSCWAPIRQWSRDLQRTGSRPPGPLQDWSVWDNSPWDLCCQDELAQVSCFGGRRAECCLGAVRNATAEEQAWAIQQLRWDLRRWLRSDGVPRKTLTVAEVHAVHARRAGGGLCLFNLHSASVGRVRVPRVTIEQHCPRGVLGDADATPDHQSASRQGPTYLGEPRFRAAGVVRALAELNRLRLLHQLLPRGGLAFLFAPTPLEEEAFTVPVFMEAMPTFQRSGILFPVYQTFMDHIQQRHVRTLAFAALKPWSERRPMLFWRGALRASRRCPCSRSQWLHGVLRDYASPARHSAGARCNQYNSSCNASTFSGSACRCGEYLASEKHTLAVERGEALQLNRIALCELAARHPDLLDAGITYDGGSHFQNATAWHRWARPHASTQDHIAHRYLLSVDGHSIDANRMWLFLTGSLVFKQVTTVVGLGADSAALRPFEHYIPVREDFADVPERILWARGNDELSQRIAENGQRSAFERLGTVAAGITYTSAALREYAGLFVQ